MSSTSNVSESTHVSTATSVDADVTSDQRSSVTQRRPYQSPGFVVSQAFERQALSCAGCLNQSASFPTLCAMRS